MRGTKVCVCHPPGYTSAMPMTIPLTAKGLGVKRNMAKELERSDNYTSIRN